MFREKPCNPAVGGPAKSQLVHEVDALGGDIGKVADRYVFASSKEIEESEEIRLSVYRSTSSVLICSLECKECFVNL